MNGNLPCPVCGALAYEAIVTLPRMPLIGCLFALSQEEALRAACGTFALVSCGDCGHVFNRAFEPARVAYAPGYENALNFSPRHRTYIERTVDALMERHGLRNKTVIEIGCGQADFLQQLCIRGSNHGVGYDPSQISREAIFPGGGSLRVIGASFDDSKDEIADAVLCQHVLEHLPRPGDMLRLARRHLDASGVAYIEVPNAGVIFAQRMIWDLTYEHVSYFSSATLNRLLAESGFTAVTLSSRFGRQYLAAEASPHSSPVPKPNHEDRTALRQAVCETVAHWRDRIASWKAARRRVLLWGAGTKAVSFLNMTETSVGSGIDYVVDVNPRKLGRHISGTGQRIVDPAFLRDYAPDTVIVMNGEYRDEIATALTTLGVRAALLDSTAVSVAA